jgi:glycosyltransferase involved in cell wall biosynthesis
MSLLTVITPSKNHLEGLRVAAESLATQSFKDWEHLVIDSASTDGTVDYCRNRPQTRIISEPDNCLEAALIKGLRLARGKHVTFLLCHDSLIDPDWLKAAIDFLESNPAYSMITACTGTKRTDISYNYDAYPSGPKFNYYFFIAPWTLLNETAFVGRTSIIREQFPDFQSSNRRQDIFLHLWINFFSMGYLARILPYAVVKNDDHGNSRAIEQLKSGEFRAKEHDFLDHKRVIRRRLLRGEYHLDFKGSENEKLSVAYSRFAFVCATLYYKWSVFFIKKILRRKIHKMQYEYCLHLARKCVDRVVRADC